MVSAALGLEGVNASVDQGLCDARGLNHRGTRPLCPASIVSLRSDDELAAPLGKKLGQREVTAPTRVGALRRTWLGFSDFVALITGASGGIGRELAISCTRKAAVCSSLGAKPVGSKTSHADVRIAADTTTLDGAAWRSRPARKSSAATRQCWRTAWGPNPDRALHRTRADATARCCASISTARSSAPGLDHCAKGGPGSRCVREFGGGSHTA